MTHDTALLPAAGAFRALRAAFEAIQLFPEPDDAEHRAAEKHLRDVRALIERHPDAFWREALHHAVEAAKLGQDDIMLLRFAHDTCTDHGHAINMGEANWPETLTGDAAKLYGVWKTQFHPQGFSLDARILAFPHGNMGDAGLFLSWQEKK